MNSLEIAIDSFKKKLIKDVTGELAKALTETFEKDLGYGSKRLNDIMGKLNKRLPPYLQLERRGKQ
jgi:hypothetical protein